MIIERVHVTQSRCMSQRGMTAPSSRGPATNYHGLHPEYTGTKIMVFTNSKYKPVCPLYWIHKIHQQFSIHKTTEMNKAFSDRSIFCSGVYIINGFLFFTNFLQSIWHQWYFINSKFTKNPSQTWYDLLYLLYMLVGCFWGVTSL